MDADVTDKLAVHIYAAPLGGDHTRALAAIRGFERALPGLSLKWKILRSGKPSRLQRRDEWVAKAVLNEEFPLLCNGDESHPITISGFEFSGTSIGRKPFLSVHAKMPLDARASAAASDILEALGDGLEAIRGDATPFRASVEIAKQVIHSPVHPSVPQTPPRGLPALKPAPPHRPPEIPPGLGWLLYWSPRTAEALGFPDPRRDADLLATARRTKAGAWIVRLTDAPLDLDNPSYLEALRKAYDRFPMIGGRSES